MKKLLLQALRFFAVSGTGWILDFSLYIILTNFLNFNVAYANMVSCIPAVTFVFIVSTHKIFDYNKSQVPLIGKYLIYFLYQLVLVFCVSWLGQAIFLWLSSTYLMRIAIIASHLKLICKIIITPVTMTVNFFVMKYLSEKL